MTGPQSLTQREPWKAAVGLPAYVTNTVREITGISAWTFREWAADHAADFAG